MSIHNMFCRGKKKIYPWLFNKKKSYLNYDTAHLINKLLINITILEENKKKK